jgi:zinc protease
MLAGYERSYNERDKAASGPFASELLRYFLDQEGAPGIAVELQLVREYLPTITAEETGEVARALLPESNRVVIATSPQKSGLTPVTVDALRGAMTAASSAPLEAWHDETTGRPLIARAPTPGTVVSRREIPEIGVTVLKLSNGVEVWLKPTDFRNDQVVFTGYARGGTSLVPADQYVDAAFSTALVGLAGVGGFSPVDLSKELAGHIASASAYVSDYTHGVRGTSTPKDLETALQLLYLDFTAPNDDPAAFALLTRRLQASVANRAQNPGAVFGDRVRAINTLDHYSTRPITADQIAHLDASRELAFYRRLFGNAADFTFFFVGAFNVNDVTPLIEKYVASLPASGTPAARLGDMALQFPDRVQKETVTKGREPRSQTVISFFADTRMDEMETYRLRAAAAVFENRLRDILREDMGGTYSVGVGYSDTSPQPGYGTVTVQFGSAPENVQKLTDAVMTELARLKKDGPTAADVQAVKETEKTDLQTSLRQNGYWLNSLQAMHLLGRDPRGINDRIRRADSLTPENLHQMFVKYFPTDRYTVVSLMPEAPKAADLRR